MRKGRLDHVIAGALLAASLAAPTLGQASPERVRSVVPPPPSINGQSAPRHRITPAQETHDADTAPAPRQDAAPSPPPAPPPAPAADLKPSDTGGLDIKGTLDRIFAASESQISGKLREVITSRQFDKRIAREGDRKAIEAFYAARNYAPLWIGDGRLNSRAKAAIARLKDAAADGLDPRDYPAPEFATINSADALAEADVKLTDSVMTYARHLQAGRIAPTRVLTEVDYGDHTPQPGDILRKIAESHDESATLDSFNPPHADFRALKAKLAELRGPHAEVDDRIPDGPLLKPGMRDRRVPLLRERLRVSGKHEDLLYDRKLYNAIRSLQKHADLRASGVIDNKTLAAINGPTTGQEIDTVAANMERWRWLPRDLGRTYVMVNVPDYTLKVEHDNQVEWRTKIVAGKPQTPTPLLTATMDSVLVNPSWYVPQSIIQNEYLPLYASDPNIFDRLGLEVRKGPDGHINVVQPPGAANALGRIKFNFPNKFQVYLHDTPEKRLFAADRRAFSHGCMRVEDPTKFGEIMLHLAMAGPTPSSRQLDALFGKDEKIFKLTSRPMVHLTYQTAFVDDQGKLQIRPDIYGFDARIHAIMHSDERRVADIAPPKDPKRDLETAKSNQEILRRVERREAQNPLVFFERLFR
jgi:murein L,D-transpeptidase YcbB/YkuD